MQHLNEDEVQRRETMRVMVLVKASKKSEQGIMPRLELLEAMGKFKSELIAAGIMKTGDGLKFPANSRLRRC